MSENEYSPEWVITPSDITLSENTATGETVGQYTAEDLDLGSDGDVAYELVSVLDGMIISSTFDRNVKHTFKVDFVFAWIYENQR